MAGQVGEPEGLGEAEDLLYGAAQLGLVHHHVPFQEALFYIYSMPQLRTPCPNFVIYKQKNVQVKIVLKQLSMNCFKLFELLNGDLIYS